MLAKKTFLLLGQDSKCEKCLKPIPSNTMVAIINPDNSCCYLSCLACMNENMEEEKACKTCVLDYCVPLCVFK